MDVEGNSLLIQKELITTKKGKYSNRKYIKNKCKIFLALSLAVDIEMEKNKDKIAEDMKKYLEQFADVKDIVLGDKYKFAIKD